MKASQKSKLHIPKPCHEDWATMTPEAQGRHCAICDKVVRDFTNSPTSEIEAVLKAEKGNVCGRVKKRDLAPEPISGYCFQLFPIQRLRFFLLAFVCAFGLEVWGISTVEAQSVEGRIASLNSPEVLKEVIGEDSSRLQVKGLVKDVFTQQPVGFVTIKLIQNGVVVGGALTDEEGRFAFDILKSELDGDFYDLKMTYLGRERIDENLNVDVKEVAYLIDPGVELEGIEIVERGGWITGDIITVGAVCSFETFDNKILYRPLDEWLMMNNSEIHHSGRW